MLQSPDLPGAAGQSYSVGWSAISRLVRQGLSWNGNERNVAFLNLGEGRFADVSAASGLDFPDDGRAAARVDWDGDGSQDLIVMNRTGPRIRVLVNRHAGPQHWIAFRLRGRSCNRSAVGARVSLETTDGRRLIRSLRCGEGFLAQSTWSVHFGLGDGEVGEVQVHWPGGEVESFGAPTWGRTYALEQDSGSAVPVPPPTAAIVPGPLSPPEADGSSRTVLSAKLPMPRLLLETLDGRTAPFLGIDERGPRGTGQPLILVLWGSFCAPCVRELRALKAEAQGLAAAGIQVLAVSVDRGEEDRQRARALLEEIEWPFAAGFASEEALGVVEVLQGALHDSARPLVVPTTLLIEPDGYLVETYRGRLEPRRLIDDLALCPLPLEARRDAAAPFPGRWIAPASEANRGAFASRFAANGLERAAAEYSLAQVEIQELSAATFQYEAGVARQRQGRLDEALRHFEQARAIDPAHFLAARGRALVLHQKGENRLALAAYREALRLEPGDALTRFNLGLVLLALGDEEGARGEVRALRRLGSDMAATLEERIRIVAGDDG